MQINSKEPLFISGCAEESSYELDKGRNEENMDKWYSFDNSETKDKIKI